MLLAPLIAPVLGGLGSAGLSIGSSANARAEAIGEQTYNNALSIAKTRIQNEQTDKAKVRAGDAAVQQVIENRDAAFRAFSQEQARFNEQLMGFSLGRQSLIKQRILAEGSANASERYGRSAGRIRNLDIVGEYGRQNAIFSENVASAERAYGRNIEDIQYQRDKANRGVVQGLSAQLYGYQPVMAEQTYTPNTGNGLMIANALAGGIQSGFSLGQSLGLNKAALGIGKF